MSAARDKLEQERLRRQAKKRRAAQLLKETGIIACGTGRDELFMMLHPSTTISGGWQVSYFKTDGPIGHEENKAVERVIDDALCCWRLASVRPVTEREFMAVSSTPEFAEGVQRVTYVGLVNKMSWEFGGNSPEVMAYIAAAQSAESLDEAIDILEAGLRRMMTERRNREVK